MSEKWPNEDGTMAVVESDRGDEEFKETIASLRDSLQKLIDWRDFAESDLEDMSEEEKPEALALVEDLTERIKSAEKTIALFERAAARSRGKPMTKEEALRSYLKDMRQDVGRRTN